jgi:hypothetical protein
MDVNRELTKAVLKLEANHTEDEDIAVSFKRKQSLCEFFWN